MPYMLPYEEKTIVGVSNVTWRVEPDGSAVHYLKEPLPLAEGQRKILIAFNQWRLMNGLPAVRINSELTDACMKHCAYMDRNGMEHVQEPDKQGYTVEGDQAGRRSCLSEESPDISVTMFYASFYHRLPVFLPGTRSIGVGHSGRYTAIDALSDKADRPWLYPIIIPAPNTFAHPTLFARESPNPGIPEGMKAGFPITLTFEKGAKITEARAELRYRHRNGYLPTPVLVSSPEIPANKDRPDNRNTICIIPREPLRPGATYQVEVHWKENGEERREEWLFNTGRMGPNPRLR